MIVVACDHAGFALKQKFIEYFKKNDVVFFDCGATEFDAEDSYVKYAKDAIKYFDNNYQYGDLLLLICGSGVGMSIVANRQNNIRAVLAKSAKQAKQAREHNDANCLCIGARNTGFWHAKQIFKKFIQTKFLGGKYKSRIDEI